MGAGAGAGGDSFAGPMEEPPQNAPLCAAQARCPAPGRRPGGAPGTRQASDCGVCWTYAVPHLAVQARIELARVHLALTDVAGVRTLMREVNEILNRRPDLGTLTGEAQELRAQLSARRGPSASGASSLTAAELRVLPLLATHLSFAGDRRRVVLVDEHAVKSQAMLAVPEAGDLLPQPGDLPCPSAGAAGRVSPGLRAARGGCSRARSEVRWCSDGRWCMDPGRKVPTLRKLAMR